MSEKKRSREDWKLVHAGTSVLRDAEEVQGWLLLSVV